MLEPRGAKHRNYVQKRLPLMSLITLGATFFLFRSCYIKDTSQLRRLLKSKKLETRRRLME